MCGQSRVTLRYQNCFHSKVVIDYPVNERCRHEMGGTDQCPNLYSSKQQIFGSTPTTAPCPQCAFDEAQKASQPDYSRSHDSVEQQAGQASYSGQQYYGGQSYYPSAAEQTTLQPVYYTGQQPSASANKDFWTWSDQHRNWIHTFDDGSIQQYQEEKAEGKGKGDRKGKGKGKK